MCNLADRIEEKALEKGKSQGIKQGIKQGIEQGIEQEKIHTVVTLVERLKLPFEEVIRILELPEHLIDVCREYVLNVNKS